MKAQRQFLMKPEFLRNIKRLPAKDIPHIMEKVEQLINDPHPDGHSKKQLTHHPGRPYRLRSGRYRIIYNFNQEWIQIITVDLRDEGTYREPIVSSEIPDLTVPDDPEEDEPAPDPRTYWQRTYTQQPGSRALPEPITVELLRKLQVPEVYHARLLRVTDEDGIYTCPGIKDEIRLELHDYMFTRPLTEVVEEAMQEHDLIGTNVDDLLRYKEGELLAFLLKLSPEQEKYAVWSSKSAGPTLVKGGPGTGKSTVALYRIRSLLNRWAKGERNSRPPRILFTTYTNALVKSSQQLLQQLLGAEARHVRIETADSIAYAILNECKQVRDLALVPTVAEQQDILRQAINATSFNGNLLRQQAQRQTLERMGLDYLLQELNSVIVARQLPSLEAYQQTPRTGRKLRLNAIQREAVWSVYEQWQRLLQARKQETWQQRRARAQQLVAHSSYAGSYDAVVIDEAQDLDSSVLRLLVDLCKTPAGLFITADANQSIYGSSFAWSDVHASLKFQGRTSILRANYRSTAEIGEAAQSYLAYGTLDDEISERHYINNGPMPDARTVLDSSYEAQLLASYFKKACRSLRMTLGSCAVLCPTDYAGKTLASTLNDQGIEATYMTGHDLNLARSGVKVITLQSSKGLEFPIVALAGFTLSSYPPMPREATAEEIEEILARERRTIFVGMTRAMRALLVVVPHGDTSPVLQGFDASYWNFTGNI